MRDIAHRTGRRRWRALCAALGLSIIALVPAWASTREPAVLLGAFAPRPVAALAQDDGFPSVHGFLLDPERGLIPIDVPGAEDTEASGINERGQIVGNYDDSAGVRRGFLRDGDRYSDIVAPNTSFTQPGDINAAGQIVGGYLDRLGRLHGFIRSGRGYAELNLRGALEGQASGINDATQIVGGLVDAGGAHGFLLEQGRFERFDADGDCLGAVGTVANRTNAAGAVVGFYVDVDGIFHGFVREGGVCSPIDAPGAVLGTIALGINDLDQIVGVSLERRLVGALVGTGFLLDHGVFTPIEIEGAEATAASDINNRGQIVGFFVEDDE